MRNSLRFSRTADSNHPANEGVSKSCRSEAVALRASSKAVFEPGPEFRPETRS